MKSTKEQREVRISERSPASLDDAIKKFTAKNLSPADQRITAINLGKIAALLDPNNPLDGAKRIVAETKLGGVWEKRKRYFRLPGEDAPAASGNGTYNANPAKFLSLAQAAGRLFSKSNDENLQKQGEDRTVRLLLQGTRYLPTYMPETQAERSLKGILEEYAVRLKEAIETRTRIIDLWKAIEATPISLEVSEEPLPQSAYGSVAAFPKELLQPNFGDHIKYGQFQPSATYEDSSWVEPTLTLGYFMAVYEVYALKIPHDKGDLFSFDSEEFFKHERDRNMWLESIGYDVEEKRFFNQKVGRNQIELEPVTVGFIHKVGITVKKGPDGRVEIRLNVWESWRRDMYYIDFLVSAMNHYSPSFGVLEETFSQYVKRIEDVSLPREAEIGPALNEVEEDGYTYDDWIEEYGFHHLLAEGLSWHEEEVSKVLFFEDRFEVDYWVNEEEYEEYQEFSECDGWIDDPICAKLLLGSKNIVFLPTVEDAEAKAGAAREGSIAAALLENAISASPESRITQLLIEKAALTAEAGLTFCEALLERSRMAIKNI